jgi:pimeloyl-ACP methyl ester carboxylesterase/DNA-binding winged helix-turn-helix (wHTH) protein
LYRFDDCEVDVARFEVRCHGEVVHLEPQVFDLLVYLLERRDRVVTKTELLDSVWGDRFVGESALTTRVKAARRAVGDDGATQRVIRTVHRRGYQFVADVDVDTDGAQDEVAATASPSRVAQDIRFCVSADGTRIAYASIGDGPPLMKAANWMTHLGHDIESTVWRHWLDGLSQHRRLVRYDERGCGMSDWDVDGFCLEAWVDDLELVADAAGIERFPLLGLSQGGAVAVAYAVRHPDRVSRLVLWGSYPRGRLARATTDDERREAALDIELARVGWGRDDASFRQVFTSQFLPDASREVWDEFDTLQRRTTSPHNAVRFLEAFSKLDVSDLAARVQCPTLILHARDDHRVPLECARDFAALIPDSRLVPLPSSNHILTSDEPAWAMFLDELNRFLADDADDVAAGSAAPR